MRAVEGDKALSNARVVRFVSTVDPPEGVKVYLKYLVFGTMPVVHVATSCFEERRDVAPSDKKVLVWVNGVSPQLNRDMLNHFLGIVVERPETAVLRDVTKGERKRYHVPVGQIFEVPRARFCLLNPLHLEHFSILEKHEGPGLAIVCRVKPVPPVKGRGLCSALTHVEILEPKFKKNGYKFALYLKERVDGAFGIRYRSSHQRFMDVFGNKPEVIQGTAIPFPLVDAVPAKATV